MANALEMAHIQAIQQLHAAKWSQRRIARELGIDRGTVARCLRALQSEPKAAIPPTGSEGSKAATFQSAPAPMADRVGGGEVADQGGVPKAAIPPTGKVGSDDTALQASNVDSCSPHTAGRPSDCEPFRDLIVVKLDQGLSAQRIYQDLTREHAAAVKYDSVKRFVRRLRATTPLPFRRMECAAGEEAQVDFGTGARLIGADGKRRM